jgi:pimeloyl-ACP methyl ester carboxylesterase
MKVAMPNHFVDIEATGRRFTIEYQWVNPHHSDAPLLIFLHEGLGSVAIWKDFPQRLCDAGGYRGLLYSRPGYGWSTPRATEEKWPVDYLQTQAIQVLPALLHALGLDDIQPWLFGHSDGGSIALIYAAMFPQSLSGAAVLAPHVFVEDFSLDAIRQTVVQYRHSPNLKQGLARYHADPDSAFYGWSDAWLAPQFKAWNIEAMLSEIRVPLLAIQGIDDEYATMEQLDRIKANVPHCQLQKFADCGHTPHRDQPQRVIDAVLALIGGKINNT